MIEAFAVIFIIGLVSGLFTSAGYVVWRRLVRGDATTIAFTTGVSFFTGVVLFITLFGAIEFCSGSARIGLFAALCALIVIAARYFPWERAWPIMQKYGLLLGLIFSIWLLVDCLHALQPLPQSVLNPADASPAYGFIAAEHSFRIENIAVTLVSGDALPFINQNSAQAILAAIPLLLGADMPQFSILLWHATVLLFAVLLVWGCARIFLSRQLAFIPVLLVVAGNTALSHYYVSLTDSGHALLMVRNYEVVIGLATLIIAGLIFRTIIRAEATPFHAAFLFCIAFSWSVIGAHLSLIVIALACYMYLLRFRADRLTRFSSALLLVLIGTLLGALALGGLFAFHAPDSPIPGVKSVRYDTEAGLIAIRPFRTVEAEYHAELKIAYLLDQLAGREDQPTPLAMSQGTALPLESSGGDTSHLRERGRFHAIIEELKTNETLWNLIRFARSLQLVCIPLFGLAFGYWYLFRRRDEAMEPFRELYLTIVPLFLVGWCVSSVILIYGQYGEASRFFAPGISATLFMLGLFLAKPLLYSGVKRRIGVALLMGISVLPVALHYVLIDIAGNFILPTTQSLVFEAYGVGEQADKADLISVEERIDVLFGPGTIRGNGL